MKTFLLILLGAWVSSSFATTVPVARVTTSINPGTADYIATAVDKAEASGAPFLILEMDTPGGLLSSTRLIVQKILNSKIPVVVYVTPKGARATSAGAIIALASEVAAMTPGTHIGAAHPVTGGGEKLDDSVRNKMVNDTVAFTESLARATGRNPEWAAKIVRESLAIPAEDAVKSRAVELLAGSRSELIKQLAGWKWKKTNPAQAQLAKDHDAAIEIIAPSLKQDLVSFFSDPTLAYLVLSLAGLCLWIELSHPGLILPGVLAVFCGLLSLVSFQLMPISYGAVGLMVLGMAMLFAELFLPTFGLLGVGGVLCFIFGSLFLVDTQTGALGVPLSLVLSTAACLSAAALGLGILVWRTRGVKKLSDGGAMVGEVGEVTENVDHERGMVLVRGELWKARGFGGAAFTKGARVEVVGIKDLTITVRALTQGH